MGPRDQGRRQVRRLIACAAAAAALLPAAGAAAELYRWVDAQGRPHLSDRPPPNPPANMSREVLPDPATNTQQRSVPPPVRQRGPTPVVTAPRGPVPDGVAPAPAMTECQARWADYQDSQACFESYRTFDAGLRPEAFQNCGPEVLDPSPECGPPR